MPARAASTIRSAWVGVGVQIATASASSKTSSTVARVRRAEPAGDAARRVLVGVLDRGQPRARDLPGEQLGVHAADAPGADHADPDALVVVAAISPP